MKKDERGKSTPNQLIIAIILFPIILAFLLSPKILAQENSSTPSSTPAAQGNSSPTPSNVPIHALVNVIIAVKPDKDDATKYNVTLWFVPVTTNPVQQAKGELLLGTGNERVITSHCDAKPDGMAKVIDCGSEVTKLSATPTNIGEKLAVIATLFDSNVSKDLESFGSISEDYSQIVKRGGNIMLTYNVSGAFENQDRNSGKWFHWFPFDTQTIEIPLKVFQQAYIRDVEISKSPDRIGVVNFTGITPEIKFEDKTTAFKYTAENVYYPSTYISKDENASLKINIQRPALQRFYLTAVQIIFGIIAGFIIGYVASLRPDSTFWGSLIEILGIVTIPFVIRATVYSTYGYLPNFLIGGIPNVFDIFFIISWFFLGVIAYKTKGYFEHRRSVRED